MSLQIANKFSIFTLQIAWSIIAVTNRVELILMNAVLSGCGCAVFLEVTIYISEISQDSIRGMLTTGANQFLGIGFLVSYFLGGLLEYYTMVYTCLTLAVLGVLIISVLKESPLTLMANGKYAVSYLFLL